MRNAVLEWGEFVETRPRFMYGVKVPVSALIEARDVGTWCPKCQVVQSGKFCSEDAMRLCSSPREILTTLYETIAEKTDFVIWRNAQTAIVGVILSETLPLQLTPETLRRPSWADPKFDLLSEYGTPCHWMVP